MQAMATTRQLVLSTRVAAVRSSRTVKREECMAAVRMITCRSFRHQQPTTRSTHSPWASSLLRRRQFSTEPQNNLSKKPSRLPNDWDWLPSLFGRLVTAFGLVHVVSEYGVELTLCEGPSMMPTIYPQGEIILVDRFTPRIHGIQGGSKGEERARLARQQQDEFDEEQEAQDVHDYEWYQPMIPANELPSSGVWKRFWIRLTTGISVGDVVVVQHPDRMGTVCKRVLGLPGDIVVRPPMGLRHYHNRRGGRSRGRRQQQRGGGDVADRNLLLVIPDGHLWIEGDNTMNSSDSRNYGPIPAALVVGRVLFRVWPLRGKAMVERGARPVPPPNQPFSGSTVLPAGYEGEIIVRNVRKKI